MRTTLSCRRSRATSALVGRLAAIAAIGLTLSCSQTYDAGETRPHGLLPVDERNPIILTNDSVTDNWQGEYAILLANSGGPELAGIVVNANAPWPDLQTNVDGWRNLVAAARQSGLSSVPNPIASISVALKRPASGNIQDTKPNFSEGAVFILNTSARLSLPYRPVVVATGGRLTDVADAYLIDPSVSERVVVVSSLGALSGSGAAMANPNGEMDPWADTIVTENFRYVQVSAYYDQLSDLPTSRVAQLPSNAFGAWMAAKQPNIFNLAEASDQVAIAAVGLSKFAVAVARVSPVAPSAADSNMGPALAPNPNGRDWLVTQNNSALATARLWELLLDPATFAH